MKKIETFLYNYSWLLKVGIWTLLIFWAGQSFTSVKTVFLEEMEREKNRDWAEEKKANREIDLLVTELIISAQKKGDDYSPPDYFEDLKRVNRKESEIGEKLGYSFSYGFPSKISNLQHIIQNNIDNKFTGHDVETAAASYRRWIDPKIKSGEEFSADIEKMSWNKIFDWVKTLYLRSFLLITLLYCIRMSERKGIPETILADKKKFLLSVLLWPIFLFRYPFNIVREIRVEAELRRIGSLFRRFSQKEKKQVQDIAGGEDYKDWIDSFKLANTGLLRPVSFVLIPTIILYFFLPPLSTVSPSEQTRDGPAISSNLSDLVSLSDVLDNSPEHPKAIHVAYEFIFKPIIKINFCGFNWKNHLPFKEPRKIEHIPICIPFFHIDYLIYQ